MNELDFRPKTRSVPARLIRNGHVVMESYEHPCSVVRVSASPNRVTIYARYVWQAATEPVWTFGTFHPDELLERAI